MPGLVTDDLAAKRKALLADSAPALHDSLTESEFLSRTRPPFIKSDAAAFNKYYTGKMLYMDVNGAMS